MTEPGGDLLGAQALGKAVEKSVDGVGAFFGALCMPAAEEFGLLLRDQVAAYRMSNLAKIAEKARRKIEYFGIRPTSDTSPKVVKEIIEESSWADDARVQEMWAGLIANSARNTRHSDDSLVYIETLKRLTPFQARVVNLIYSDPRCCSVRDAGKPGVRKFFSPENELLYTTPQILRQYPGDLHEIVPIAYVTAEEILSDRTHYPIAISRFWPQLVSLVTLDLLEHVEVLGGEQHEIRFLPTYQGLDFYMRCLGYNLYPIEAFLVTLQHWCAEKGVDPFTYESEDAT